MKFQLLQRHRVISVYLVSVSVQAASCRMQVDVDDPLHSLKNPRGPCTRIVYTLALKYLYRDYIKAKVYTIWVHGPSSPKPYKTLKGTLIQTL